MWLSVLLIIASALVFFGSVIFALIVWAIGKEDQRGNWPS